VVATRQEPGFCGSSLFYLILFQNYPS
jgi:hypothetical protein